MLDKNFVEAVYERDVDLLLLEELASSRAFCQWFIDLVFQDDQPAGQLVGVWHSLSREPLGESDLVYVEQDEEGTRAILIENKIDAAPQPEQAERYRARGQLGIEDGDWYDFRTCLVAPRKYLRITSNATLYDAQLSYEQIRNFLLAVGGDNARTLHKAGMLNEAIAQNRRGYQPIPHPAVTDFWHDYWENVQENYPFLIMKEPGGVPARSDWPEFLNDELGKKSKIVHKLAFGHVELYFRGYGHKQEELALLNVDLFGEDILVAGTRKTAFVQIKVPSVDRFLPYSVQREAVDVALQAAVHLLTIYPRIKLPALSPDQYNGE